MLFFAGKILPAQYYQDKNRGNGYDNAHNGSNPVYVSYGNSALERMPDNRHQNTSSGAVENRGEDYGPGKW